jgi:hypothetical protein
VNVRLYQVYGLLGLPPVEKLAFQSVKPSLATKFVKTAVGREYANLAVQLAVKLTEQLVVIWKEVAEALIGAVTPVAGTPLIVI